MSYFPYDARTSRRVSGSNTAAWAALAFGVLFGMILGLYAISDTDTQIAANDRAIEQTLPSTTGQGERRD